MAYQTLDSVALEIGGDTVVTITGTSPVRIVVPPLTSGRPTKFVQLISGVVDAFVKVGDVTVDADVGDSLPIRVADNPTILNVSGATHISMDAGSAGSLYVTPMRNI